MKQLFDLVDFSIVFGFCVVAGIMAAEDKFPLTMRIICGAISAWCLAMFAFMVYSVKTGGNCESKD